jgi:hypothetical protein
VTTQDVKAALESARREHPELARTIDLELELLGEARVAIPAGFAALAAERVAAEQAAIDPQALELDWAALGRRIREVSATVARADARLAAGARRLSEVDARGASARFLAGGEVAAGVDPAVATLVMTHALRPFLRALATVVQASPAVKGWARGVCPCCGGAPDFAALEGEGGARRLLCGRCDCEWSFARTGCPFCGTSDARQLAYYAEGRYRLYVCDGCHGYLKTLDRRETWGDTPLPVERVLAVGLDVAATRAGWGPAFRN